MSIAGSHSFRQSLQKKQLFRSQSCLLRFIICILILICASLVVGEIPESPADEFRNHINILCANLILTELNRDKNPLTLIHSQQYEGNEFEIYM